jgi:hypothetical protein
MGARDFQLTTPGPLRIYSTTELLNLPAPTWMIDRIIPSGGLVAIYGAPGCGKSFVALDIAFSIATAQAWQGHEVQPGHVLYLAAEGGAGMSKRARAWLQHNGVRASQTNIAWLIESIPVHVDSDQMTVLLERIQTEIEDTPNLVIIDTLARCFDGEESETGDMGRFIGGVDHLRSTLGCTVMVIHHTRLAGDRERGNTAFRGAADAMLSVEKDGPDITISCTKQKDAEEFEAINLELTPVEGTDSCVVSSSGAAIKRDEEYAVVLDALDRLQPCKWDDWTAATGLSPSRFFKYFPGLKKNGVVIKENGLWRIANP